MCIYMLLVPQPPILAVQACLLVCNLTTLTSLGLTFCNLAAVHPALAHLVHLLSLDISDNNLYPEVQVVMIL